MNEGDRHTAFTDGRRDPLDRARPYVSAREHAGNARLEKVWVPVERPAARRSHIGARENEAARVERDLGWKPSSFGVGSDEDEQPA
jgi:hypothetical protein